MARRRGAPHMDAEFCELVEQEPDDPLENCSEEDLAVITVELDKFENALKKGNVMRAMAVCDKLLEYENIFYRDSPFLWMVKKLYEHLRVAKKYENFIFQQFAALNCSDTLLFCIQDHFRRRPFHTKFTLGKTFLSDARRRQLALTLQAPQRTLVFGTNTSHCLGVADTEMDFVLEAATELIMPTSYHCHTSGTHTVWMSHTRVLYGCGFARNFMITRLRASHIVKPCALDIKWAPLEFAVGFMTFPYGTLFQTNQRWHFVGNYEGARAELDVIVSHSFVNALPGDPFSNYYKCDWVPQGNIMRWPRSDDSRNVAPLVFKGTYKMIRILTHYWTECDPVVGSKRRPILFLLDGVEVKEIQVDNVRSGCIWVVHKNLLYEGFMNLMMKAKNNGDEYDLDNYFLMVELIEHRTPSPYHISSVASFDQSVIVTAGQHPWHLFDHVAWRENYYRGPYVHNYMYECVANFMENTAMPELEENLDGEECEDEELDEEDEVLHEEEDDYWKEGPKKSSEAENAPTSSELLLEPVPNPLEAPGASSDASASGECSSTSPAAPSSSTEAPEASSDAPAAPRNPGFLRIPRSAAFSLDTLYLDPETGQLYKVVEEFEAREPSISGPTSSGSDDPEPRELNYDKRQMRQRVKIMAEAVLAEANKFTNCPDLARPLRKDGCGRLVPECRYANYFSFLAYISMPRVTGRPMKFMDTDMDRLVIVTNEKTLAHHRMKTLYQEFERVNYPGIDVWKPVEFLRTRPPPEQDLMEEDSYRTTAMYWALHHFIYQFRNAWRMHEYEWSTPLNLHLFSILLGTLRCIGSLVRLRFNEKLYRELPLDQPVYEFLQNHVNSVPDNELLFQTVDPGAILRSRIEEGFLKPGDLVMDFETVVKYRLKHEDQSLADSDFQITTSMLFLNCQNPTLLPYINGDNVLDLNEIYKDCNGLERLITQTHFIQNGVSELGDAIQRHERRLCKLGWRFYFVQRYLNHGEKRYRGFLQPKKRGGPLVDIDPLQWPGVAEALECTDGKPVYVHRDLTRLFSLTTLKLPNMLPRRLLIKAMRGLYDRQEYAYMRIEDRLQVLDFYFLAVMPEAFNDLLKQIIIEAKPKDAHFIRYAVECYAPRACRFIAQYRPGILMWNTLPLPVYQRLRYVKIITEMWPKNEWNRPRRVPPKNLPRVNGTTEPSKFWKIDPRELQNWVTDGKEGIAKKYYKQLKEDFPMLDDAELNNTGEESGDELEELDEHLLNFHLHLFDLKEDEKTVEAKEPVETARYGVEYLDIETDDYHDHLHWTEEADRQLEELKERLSNVQNGQNEEKPKKRYVPRPSNR